jgi:NHLM bacteriocin system ABC transporter ATP-binding protein
MTQDPRTPERDANALLEAFRLIARQLGLVVKMPHADTTGDPVLALARASKIRLRKVRLRGRWWRRDAGPLLAFSGNGQALALIPSGSSRYRAHDPVANRVIDVDASLAASLRPIAFMCYPSLGDRAATVLGLWWLGARGLGRDFRLVAITSLLASLAALAPPILTRVLIDDVVPTADRLQIPLIAVFLLVFATASALLELSRGLTLQRIESSVELATESALMDRVLRLPPPFFKEFATGDLAQRVRAFSAIRALLSGHALTTILTGLFSLSSLLLLAAFDTRLALAGAGIALVALVVVVASSLVTLRLNRQLATVSGDLHGLVLQLFSGIAKLRAAAAESRAFGVWSHRFADLKRLETRSSTVANAFGLFQSSLPILTSMIFFMTVTLVLTRNPATPGTPTLSSGTFVAVMAAFTQFLGGFLALGSTLIAVLQIVPQYERFRPILDTPPESRIDSIDPGRLEGRIEVRHVTFRYRKDAHVILEDVSLTVEPGEMVAIVGPSGAGKSTLLRLLLGLEVPDAGTIAYDGHDLSNLDIDAVRAQMGVVLQDSRPFEGELLTAILGESSHLSESAAWDAARMVGLEEEIEAMPMKMRTRIMEGGSTFSGGQRQRVMIARAIAHGPRILFFDESTSALDNRTQDIVRRSLEGLGATRIVIAHRLSTIRHADRIIVIDEGRINDSGTFDQLMARNGTFAEMARRQMI